MHRIFQRFIDLLSSAESAADFSHAMSVTAAALDLSCFAYLALPQGQRGKPRLISTYPPRWTSRYLENHYEDIDPVVMQALKDPEPFTWGIHAKGTSLDQQRLLDEAAQFGIRFGFTVPIHDGRSPIAALTFAADQRHAPFAACVTSHGRVLQLMAMYFHAHVRRKLSNELIINGLSRRELECLQWAAQGKSAWEIGRILNISRNTVAYYLENAKEKLGVRTVVQAATRLAAAKKDKQN
ncbi:LuxR family transcriptional regulator [Bradyrhizobium sp. CCBAU 51627]|uniref:LuxR family transcriptional regulator n=1 Tax=Bradyrhizobium sp. CCBAU 51627 TaxID=1325088 RepID=UPI0023068FE0|nr:LuxR family transcriptional regulator [Bradyrhizobium sp. CCBAU 51627]MDA9433555.1 transcriptional regulator [Bradyrhizobium sp. CCBAU 51627]